MPAPTLAELRAGLKTRLDTIAGVQVTAYLLGQPTPPCIELAPDEVEYDRAMQRGMDSWRFVVRAYVGTPTDRGAQVQLDLMLAPSGSSSVKAAIEGDATLGGKAQDTRVVSASGYRIYSRAGGPEYLGCEWAVDVIAAGR